MLAKRRRQRFGLICALCSELPSGKVMIVINRLAEVLVQSYPVCCHSYTTKDEPNVLGCHPFGCGFTLEDTIRLWYGYRTDIDKCIS